MDLSTTIASAAALLSCIAVIVGLLDRRDRNKDVISEKISELKEVFETRLENAESRINKKIESVKGELVQGGQNFATYEERFKTIQRELDISRQSEKESIGKLISSLTRTLEEKSRGNRNAR